MRRNLNRKKLSVFNLKNIYISFLIILFSLSILLAYNNKNIISKIFYHSVENLSHNFQYQFTKFEINGLKRVEYSFIKQNLEKHIDSSIFLLPLEKINNNLYENNWIKNIKLRTNYKDTLYVDLEEYVPIGLYKFNDKLFYFDKKGKIIEQYKYNDNITKFKTFSGPYSNLKAKIIIEILDSLKFENKFTIKNIEYLENRRWNIYLDKNIKLMLSESTPKKSLINFINIEKNLSQIDLDNIKFIDLRDINKTIITYY